MQPGWKRRAALWLLLVEAARANRQRYPELPTAWLPHSLGNSVALWLPELLAGLDALCDLGARGESEPTLAALYQTLRELCVDNERWGDYIAPAVLGYVFSHPRMDIYQGTMGNWRVFGFGLDALPHSITAFSLTLLMRDALETANRFLPQQAPLSLLVRPLSRYPALGSLLGLILLSAIWEGGEYLIQQEELRRTGGNRDAINMQWTLTDMSHDLISNSVGWVIATWLRQRFAPSPPYG